MTLDNQTNDIYKYIKREYDDDLPVISEVIFNADWNMATPIYIYQTKDGDWHATPKTRYKSAIPREVVAATVDLYDDGVLVGADIEKDGEVFLHIHFMKESFVG